MSAALSMSNPLNSMNSHNVISSPGSVGGVSPFRLQDGQSHGGCGQDHAHANLSAMQAKERGLMTSATFGQLSNGSLNNAALQSCLANRLQARLEGTGSPEYLLTWKEWAIKGQPPICALRASAPRTSDNACSGWPTPTNMDSNRGSLPPRPTDTGIPLSQMAVLAGWVTPSSRDWKDTPGMATVRVNEDGTTRGRLDQLPRQAAIAGVTSTSPPVATEKRGALNPALPRWLMGFPPAWCDSAVTATQSFQKPRRSSSKPARMPLRSRDFDHLLEGL